MRASEVQVSTARKGTGNTGGRLVALVPSSNFALKRIEGEQRRRREEEKKRELMRLNDEPERTMIFPRPWLLFSLASSSRLEFVVFHRPSPYHLAPREPGVLVIIKIAPAQPNEKDELKKTKGERKKNENGKSIWLIKTALRRGGRDNGTQHLRKRTLPT